MEEEEGGGRERGRLRSWKEGRGGTYARQGRGTYDSLTHTRSRQSGARGLRTSRKAEVKAARRVRRGRMVMDLEGGASCTGRPPAAHPTQYRPSPAPLQSPRPQHNARLITACHSTDSAQPSPAALVPRDQQFTPPRHPAHAR